jgi:hypothetical protein
LGIGDGLLTVADSFTEGAAWPLENGRFAGRARGARQLHDIPYILN